jgi:hypothetical protein
MEKELFDELNRIGDGFWKETMALNHERIEKLQLTGFYEPWESALTNFLIVRRFDVEKNDPNIDELLGIHQRFDFDDGCNKFLGVVAIAKTNSLFIDNQLIIELNNYKNNDEKSKKLLQVKDGIITQLKNTNKDLQEKLATAIERYPTLKGILYGDKNESEVEKNV